MGKVLYGQVCSRSSIKRGGGMVIGRIWTKPYSVTVFDDGIGTNIEANVNRLGRVHSEL